jgi:hypothetical protein
VVHLKYDSKEKRGQDPAILLYIQWNEVRNICGLLTMARATRMKMRLARREVKGFDKMFPRLSTAYPRGSRNWANVSGSRPDKSDNKKAPEGADKSFAVTGSSISEVAVDCWPVR